MYIILDRPTDEEFNRIYDHINELDDKVIQDGVEVTEYVPNGPDHIVMKADFSGELDRYLHLRLAAYGARLYSNHFEEGSPYLESPLYAGPIPAADKTRKVAVDGAFAEGRASYFQQFGVNYIGRSNVDPRNIFVLDNKKGNRYLDPANDPELEALYASLPEDFWGSCGFVSTNNVTKLEAFFEASPDMIPIAYTTGAMAKIKFCGFDYVNASTPSPTPEYGVRVRDAANRLSYKLSLTPEQLQAIEEADEKQRLAHEQATELARKRALGLI